MHVAGTPVELINAFHFFERAEALATKSTSRALCYVDCQAEDGWEHRILAPLLIASGYDVSFDQKDESAAQVVLSQKSQDMTGAHDARVLRLRDSIQQGQASADSIYRYDRLGLMAAIENKIAGAR